MIIGMKDKNSLKTPEEFRVWKKVSKTELISLCYCRLIKENICKTGWRMVHWSPLLTNGCIQHKNIDER